MSEDTLLPFDLPSVARKKLSVGFDGGQLSSDAGVLLLRGVEKKLGLAARLSSCIRDRRKPERIEHPLEEMLRLRMFAIAAGYEDADDCDSLRYDPIFKMAVGHAPESGDPLCSQPTMSRLENAPSKIEIARLMAALVDGFCESYRRAPSAITLDIDDTCDTVHGQRQAGGDDPARGQDAVRRGGPHGPQACHQTHPQALAQGPHPGAWRQPLRPRRGDGVV